MPTTRIPGCLLTYQVVEAPLDHAAPDDDRTIEVFAREVVAPARPSTPTASGGCADWPTRERVGTRWMIVVRALDRKPLILKPLERGLSDHDGAGKPRMSGLDRPRANQPLPTLKLWVLCLHRILQHRILQLGV